MNSKTSPWAPRPAAEGHRPCPICRHAQSRHIKQLEYLLFDQSPMPSYMQLVACTACGFLYYEGEYGASNLDAFYQQHYFITSNKMRELHPPERQYNESSIDILLRNGVAADANIVDVGCGPGHLLKQMRERGFTRLTGIDLNDDYVRKLRLEGFSAYHASSERLPLPERADCFIYKNIFEHLYDLHKSLAEISAYIREGGHILIEVPDAASYGRDQGYHPLHYLILEHINHFDLPHLQSLLALYGFALVEGGTRLLDIAEPYPIPVLYGLFRHAGHRDASPGANEALFDQARLWFGNGYAFDKPELERLAVSQKPVYIWGLAYRTLMQCAMSPLRHCRIRGFLDADPRKQALTLRGGEAIRSPELLAKADSDATVVIGVGPSADRMRELLAGMGFDGEVVTLF